MSKLVLNFRFLEITKTTNKIEKCMSNKVPTRYSLILECNTI